MELADQFEVPLGVPETWTLLTDVGRIAPCLPGARLDEVVDGEYRGVVRVKVGPITVEYKGVASFTELDEQGRRVVLRATGRETRGQGNASATVTATLAPAGDATLVAVLTELDISGRVAQFGRGALADVSSKLLGEFVKNLERDLASGGVPATAATEAVARDDVTTAVPAVTPSNGSSPDAAYGEHHEAPASPSSPRLDAERGAGDAPASPPGEVEPINLARLTGAALLRRAAPLARRAGPLLLLVGLAAFLARVRHRGR